MLGVVALGWELVVAVGWTWRGVNCAPITGRVTKAAVERLIRPQHVLQAALRVPHRRRRTARARPRAESASRVRFLREAVVRELPRKQAACAGQVTIEEGAGMLRVGVWAAAPACAAVRAGGFRSTHYRIAAGRPEKFGSEYFGLVLSVP